MWQAPMLAGKMQIGIDLLGPLALKQLRLADIKKGKSKRFRLGSP